MTRALRPERRSLVIGGSLGGLFAAVMLRAIGWTVDVFERSSGELDGRGGGIVLQPDVLHAFRRAGIKTDGALGVVAHERLYLGRDGEVLQQMPMRQTLTSWPTLYDAMRRTIPDEHHHRGEELVGFEQDEDGVCAHFESGRVERGDLLVGADGGGSTVRSQLLPGTDPVYAGYVAYRGLVDEPDLPPAPAGVFTERFVFQQWPGSHILQYLVPGEGEAVAPGRRRFNWVWYVNRDEADELPPLLTDRDGVFHPRSLPPGLIAPAVEVEMRALAGRTLSPPFRALVDATAEPFVQPIVDLAVPRMAFGRVALTGDAAFVPRPHTAASTAKAAANAMALADALETTRDVPRALARWEPAQLALGRGLARHGQILGDRSQFPDRLAAP